MIVDIILIAIFLFGIYRGYKKGFLQSGISFIALLATLFIVLVLYIPISNVIVNCTGIDETIENSIYEKIIDKDKQDQKGMLQDLKENSLKTTSRSIAIGIVRIVVFILLLIGIRLIFGLFTGIANVLDKIPFIQKFNHILGAIFNFILYLLIVEIIFAIINLGTMMLPNNRIYEEIEKSWIGKPLYNQNIITNNLIKN